MQRIDMDYMSAQERLQSYKSHMQHTSLITGATGFIGSALVARLKAEHAVNVIGVSRSLGVDLTVADWQAKLPHVKVDTVVHLAQSTRYRDFPKSASDMVATNIDATASLLEWSRNNDVRRFIFTSTGNVYRPSDEEWDEESPLEPASFYGASKLAAEYLVKQYSKYFEVVILRLFGVYGPNQQNMLISNIIKKIRTGEEIQLAGGDGLLINPIYIDDVSYIIGDLVTRILTERLTILNLAGNENLSLMHIVNRLEIILSMSAKVVVTRGDPLHFLANTKNLISLFPVHKFVDIDVGLKNTCQA